MSSPAATHEPPWAHPLFWAALSLAVRLAALMAFAGGSPLFAVQLLDEAELAQSARALLDGTGFGPEPLFKAPLYPVLLAAVMTVLGDGWTWGIRVLHALAGALATAAAVDGARRLLAPGSARIVAGVAAGVAFGLFAPLIRLEQAVLLDSLAVALQSAMVWALIRSRTSRRRVAWVAVAGVFAGLAWLNRPTVMLALPFLAAWLAWPVLPWKSGARRRLVRAAIFLAPVVLAMAVVVARNKVSGGEALLLPWQGGYNLHEANRPGARGPFYTQQSFGFTDTGNPTKTLMRRAFDADNPGRQPGDGTYHADLDAYWKARAVAAVREDPAAWLARMVEKTVYLATNREAHALEDFRTAREQSALFRFSPVRWGVVWPLAVVSLALCGLAARGRRRSLALLWIYAIVLGGAIALYFPSGRLRMPLLYPAGLLAAFTLAQLACQARRFGATRWVATGAVAAGALALSWGNWFGINDQDWRFADYTRLSNAAWQVGDHEAALAHADRAEELRPGYPAIPLLRAQALYGLERFEEAGAAFEAAARIQPADPVPASNAGVVRLYHTGDPAGAVDWFTEALRREPAYETALWRRALALVRVGRAAEAGLPAMDSSVTPLEIAARAAVAHATGDAVRARSLLATAERMGPEAKAVVDDEYTGAIGAPPTP